MSLGPRAKTARYQCGPRRLGVGEPASCRTSSSAGSWAQRMAPAMCGAPRSVPASVLCKATLNKHQRRNQPRPLQAGRSALGWEPHQLRDKAEGLVAPAPTGLAGKNTEPLGRGTEGLGPPLSCSRGHECDVAAQCPAERPGPVSDEVEAAVGRIHAKGRRARQPLLTRPSGPTACVMVTVGANVGTASVSKVWASA